MWYHMSFSHVFEHMDGDYHTLEGKKEYLVNICERHIKWRYGYYSFRRNAR